MQSLFLTHPKEATTFWHSTYDTLVGHIERYIYPNNKYSDKRMVANAIAIVNDIGVLLFLLGHKLHDNLAHLCTNRRVEGTIYEHLKTLCCDEIKDCLLDPTGILVDTYTMFCELFEKSKANLPAHLPLMYRDLEDEYLFFKDNLAFNNKPSKVWHDCWFVKLQKSLPIFQKVVDIAMVDMIAADLRRLK